MFWILNTDLHITDIEETFHVIWQGKKKTVPIR